jgi:hypothetical protein
MTDIAADIPDKPRRRRRSQPTRAANAEQHQADLAVRAATLRAIALYDARLRLRLAQP